MRKSGDDDTNPPSSETVEALEAFGYKADKVRTWTATRANITLDEARKRDAIALRRAMAKAEKEGVKFERTAPPRGFPLPMWRLDAAKWLAEQTGADNLTGAIVSAVYQLCDSEVQRLAGYLIRILEADDGRSPDQLSYLAASADGDRSDPATEPEDPPAGDRPAEASGPAGRTRQAPAALPGLG